MYVGMETYLSHPGMREVSFRQQELMDVGWAILFGLYVVGGVMWGQQEGE